jgi:hypothetical protein
MGSTRDAPTQVDWWQGAIALTVFIWAFGAINGWRLDDDPSLSERLTWPVQSQEESPPQLRNGVLGNARTQVRSPASQPTPSPVAPPVLPAPAVVPPPVYTPDTLFDLQEHWEQMKRDRQEREFEELQRDVDRLEDCYNYGGPSCY